MAPTIESICKDVSEYLASQQVRPTGLLVGDLKSWLRSYVTNTGEAVPFDDFEERKQFVRDLQQSIPRLLFEQFSTNDAAVTYLFSADIDRVRRFCHCLIDAESDSAYEVVISTVVVLVSSLSGLWVSQQYKDAPSNKSYGCHNLPKDETALSTDTKFAINSAEDEVLDRDMHVCVVSGFELPNVCQIVPVGLSGEVSELFYDYLGELDPQFCEDVKSVLEEGLNSPRNMICLTQTLHEWWRDGWFGLEPFYEGLDEGGNPFIDVRFWWLNQTNVGLYTIMGGGFPTLGRFFDFRGRAIHNGDVIRLTAQDGIDLPSFVLLRLQWLMQLMTCLSRTTMKKVIVPQNVALPIRTSPGKASEETALQLPAPEGQAAQGQESQAQAPQEKTPQAQESPAEAIPTKVLQTSENSPKAAPAPAPASASAPAPAPAPAPVPAPAKVPQAQASPAKAAQAPTPQPKAAQAPTPQPKAAQAPTPQPKVAQTPTPQPKVAQTQASPAKAPQVSGSLFGTLSQPKAPQIPGTQPKQSIFGSPSQPPAPQASGSLFGTLSQPKAPQIPGTQPKQTIFGSPSQPKVVQHEPHNP
ncbi:hypothetical protein BROUX41_001110 [Berkeleyomyces rouxiae]|uniref:uncharacterized protein n=1 Tax=Berkeleyomyces rouxiae TaxID=2035830 RepID=UPI003B7F08E4